MQRCKPKLAILLSLQFSYFSYIYVGIHREFYEKCVCGSLKGTPPTSHMLEKKASRKYRDQNDAGTNGSWAEQVASLVGQVGLLMEHARVTSPSRPGPFRPRPAQVSLTAWKGGEWCSPEGGSGAHRACPAVYHQVGSQNPRRSVSRKVAPRRQLPHRQGRTVPADCSFAPFPPFNQETRFFSRFYVNSQDLCLKEMT